MPGAVTFDLLEGYLNESCGIRRWMWPFVLLVSLLEWWFVWTCCTLAEASGDESFLVEVASACVRGDPCMQPTTVWDGEQTPTPSPQRALPSSVIEYSDQMVLLAVTVDVQWSLHSLLKCSMRFAVLAMYCFLAFVAKLLLMLVWHPRSLVALLVLIAAAFVCCEDDEIFESKQDTAEYCDSIRSSNADRNF
jgi:hypothetical protein